MSTLLSACLPPTPPATTTLTPAPTLLTSKPVEAPPKPAMPEPHGFVQRIHDSVMAAKNHRYCAFSTSSHIPCIVPMIAFFAFQKSSMRGMFAGSMKG